MSVLAIAVIVKIRNGSSKDVVSDLYFIPFLLIPLQIYHSVLDMAHYWHDRQICIRKLESWYEFKVVKNWQIIF